MDRIYEAKIRSIRRPTFDVCPTTNDLAIATYYRSKVIQYSASLNVWNSKLEWVQRSKQYSAQCIKDVDDRLSLSAGFQYGGAASEQ